MSLYQRFRSIVIAPFIMNSITYLLEPVTENLVDSAVSASYNERKNGRADKTMIESGNGVYHIRTEAYSYLFRVDSHGIVQHLHFGRPVRTGMLPVLSLIRAWAGEPAPCWTMRTAAAAWTTSLWSGAAAAGVTTGKAP